MSEAIATGVLQGGRVTWDNAARFTSDLKALGDGSVVVKAKLASASSVRSQRANAYLWGHVYAEAAKHTGHSADDIHDAMCEKFLPNERKRVEFFSRMTGESLQIETDSRRSSKLAGNKFYDFVEEVRLFLLEFLGVETQDPDPEYWRKRASKRAA